MSKNHTLLFDVEEIEKKTSWLVDKTESANELEQEMLIEGRQWTETILEKPHQTGGGE